MKSDVVTKREDIGVFQLLVLVLSILVLAALLADTILPLPSEVSSVLQLIDTLVCVILLIDFLVRFRKAPSKLEFMKWGWIDLLASIPNLPMLRWGRLVRILRVIRVLRALRATHKITTLLLKNKFQSGVASIILTSLLLLAFASIGILICERPNPDGNIKTAEEAVWWSVSTITTVGYGDKYPITTEGRFLGMVIMVSGVGLFGGLSGLVASFFVNSKERELEATELKILKRLDQLEEKIDRLNKQ